MFLKAQTNVPPIVNYLEDFASGPSFAFFRFLFSSFWWSLRLHCDYQIIVLCFIVKNVSFSVLLSIIYFLRYKIFYKHSSSRF